MGIYSAPLRLLYIHSSAQTYGSDGGMLRLIERLDRTRFSPIVVLPENGPLVEALGKLDVQVYIQPLTVLHRTLSPV